MTAHWAPSRHVVLDGAVNVRDIGGYRTSYGLQVTRGRVFRGDALSQLTGPDTERLDRLRLRTVIDFRTRRDLGDGRAAELMVEISRGFVADAQQREAFGAALRLACSAGRLPLLYHCSSGKDRAGWMTAIVLTALGVPRELVLRDYLLSNDFHRTEYQKLRYDLVKTGIVADPELLRPIMEQCATYLGAAFEEAERRYASFGRFLADGLEVSGAMLGELRRTLLGDLVPPEPVSLAFRLALAAARPHAAQDDIGEQHEEQSQRDGDRHVGQPLRRGMVPQLIG